MYLGYNNELNRQNSLPHGSCFFILTQGELYKRNSGFTPTVTLLKEEVKNISLPLNLKVSQYETEKDLEEKT